MRLYSRGLGFRRRLGVTPRTVIGGLVVGGTVYANVVSGVLPEFMPGLVTLPPKTVTVAKRVLRVK